MFEIISLAIKKVATPFSGVLNPNIGENHYIEFQDDDDAIIHDMEMKKAHEDKMNLKKDGQNLRKDINKSVQAYHTEAC